MKSIKFLVVLICMTLGVVNVAKAQIYSNEVCYYKDTARDWVYVVKFDGLNDRVLYIQCRTKTIESRLKESIDYFEDDEAWDSAARRKEGAIIAGRNECVLYTRSHSEYVDLLKYDDELSTSKREVYKHRFLASTINSWGTHYLGFSKDKQTIISWTTLSEEKFYYNRVSKEDLLPKNVVPDFDFLNE